MTEDSARTRLQSQILSGVILLNGKEACECLGLPSLEPAQALKQYEGQMLVFQIDGRSRYPAFQFDAADGRIYPSVKSLLELSQVANWSDFRLLNWMLRPHFDFEGSPADALAEHGKEVVHALQRAMASEKHG